MTASSVSRQVTMRWADDIQPTRTLWHYTREDPYAVSLDFGDDNIWMFSRCLLAEGLRGPSGYGGVRIWPWAFGARVMVALSSLDGQAVFSALSYTVRSFLAATYDIVPAGRESEYVDVDACVTKLLAAQS